MIRGTVNPRLEAVVRLRVRGPAGAEADVAVAGGVRQGIM